MNLNQITLPAIDIAESTAFYRGMGFTQIVDSPHYARFECADGEATFSIHRVDPPVPRSGVVVYFECAELDGRVRQLVEAGYRFSKEPTDERWLWREARLQDPTGNELCLYHAGRNRRFPPWRVGASG